MGLEIKNKASILYKVHINGLCRISSKEDASLTCSGLQSRSSRMEGCGAMQSRLTCGDPWGDGWPGAPIVLCKEHKEKIRFDFLPKLKLNANLISMK